jgi:hypothetical protein
VPPPRGTDPSCLSCVEDCDDLVKLRQPAAAATTTGYAELLGIVPYFLGYHPERLGDLVVLGLRGKRVVMHARLGIEVPPDGQRLVTQLLTSDASAIHSHDGRDRNRAAGERASAWFRGNRSSACDAFRSLSQLQDYAVFGLVAAPDRGRG